MRKEYVVMRIDAAPDGSPYVVVSLSLAKDMKEGNQPPSPFGSKCHGIYLHGRHDEKSQQNDGRWNGWNGRRSWKYQHQT